MSSNPISVGRLPDIRDDAFISNIIDVQQAHEKNRGKKATGQNKYVSFQRETEREKISSFYGV